MSDQTVHTPAPHAQAAPNLADLFYTASGRFPRREALAWEDGSLTYAGLRDWIESLRPALRTEAGPHVGILAHRTPLAFAAVQAILAEGKAYVPLNPGFPSVRNAFILDKARLATLVVGEECAEALEALLKICDRPLRILALEDSPKVRAVVQAGGAGISLVELHLGAGLSSTPTAPLPESRGAYVLFTSGSTGEPKGVRVRHDNVHSYLRSFLAAYPIGGEDRLSQTFDLTFDLSVHDQFITWAAGATMVLYPDKHLFSPLPYTAEKKVTIWFSVPSLAAFLESARQVVPGALPQLRLSLFCGEKLTWKTCEIWKQVAPNSRLVNLYGPTEATIAITHFEIPRDFPEEAAYQGGIPIGRAFPTQWTEVRKDDLSPCKAGEVGGLWLGGDQITPGYLDEARKTADRFVPRDGEVWYRTGDRVVEAAGGMLHYVGREDFQVKVMGYRIELGEIEEVLMKCSGAAFAIADVAQLRGTMDEIFCVLPETFSTRKKEIKASLKDLLPAYMVPRHLFFTDDIPLNSNGKMDRGALKSRYSPARQN